MENRTLILKVKDKKEFINQFNKAKPSKQFFEQVKKVGQFMNSGDSKNLDFVKSNYN